MNIRTILINLIALSIPFSVSANSVVKKMIIKEAKEQGVKPEYALAISKTESNFNIFASHLERGNEYSVGLFQILSSTGRKECGLITRKDLESPVNNIRCGIKYLKQKLEDYKGNFMLAALSYNAGRVYRCSEEQKKLEYWCPIVSPCPADKKNHYYQCKRGGYINWSYWEAVKKNYKP